MTMNIEGTNPNFDPHLMSILSDYMDKLATYGTPEALALALEEAGVQAMPGVAKSCAIALHAAENLTTPEDVTIHVSTSEVSMHRSITRIFPMPPDREDVVIDDVEIVASVDNNAVVDDFITEFDAWQFPALVNPERLAEYRARRDRIFGEATHLRATPAKVTLADRPAALIKA